MPPYANFERDKNLVHEDIMRLVEKSKSFDEDQMRYEMAAMIVIMQALDPMMGQLVEVFVRGMLKHRESLREQS